jgi:hypothetical protein
MGPTDVSITGLASGVESRRDRVAFHSSLHDNPEVSEELLAAGALAPARTLVCAATQPQEKARFTAAAYRRNPSQEAAPR